jgi:hypothetical protein
MAILLITKREGADNPGPGSFGRRGSSTDGLWMKAFLSANEFYQDFGMR